MPEDSAPISAKPHISRPHPGRVASFAAAEAKAITATSAHASEHRINDCNENYLARALAALLGIEMLAYSFIPWPWLILLAAILGIIPYLARKG